MTGEIDGSPANDRRGRWPGAAWLGAVLGCLAVFFACAIAGIALLLFTFYGILLVISALVAVYLTALLAASRSRPLSARITMLVSGSLTVLIFLVFPVYFIVMNWGRGGTGPMFG